MTLLFKQFIFVVLLIMTAGNASAATSLPKNLNPAEQVRALEILGFGSAAKILDNPYPLGGYRGIEMGVTSEYIPVEDLADLGNGSSQRGEFNFYTLTFGKGLFYNVDTHLYFTPYVQNEDFQSYGVQVRWGFFETNFFPLSLTAVLYGGGANFANLINISTFGADVVATVSMDNVSVYAGGGSIRATGKFIGGPNGITNTQETVEQDIVETHSVFGLNVDISKMFIALQIDRYTDTVYSGKLGFRF